MLLLCTYITMRLQHRRFLFSFSVLAFIVIAFVTLLYAQGYRISDNLGLKKTGGLYIGASEQNMQIYINNRFRKKTSLLQRSLFIQNLAPATYMVRVEKDGYSPWQKQLPVLEEYVTEAKAFLVPQQPIGAVLTTGTFTNLVSSLDGSILLLTEERNDRKRIVFYRPDQDRFINRRDAATEQLLTYSDAFTILSWKDNVVILHHERGTVTATINLDENLVNAALSRPAIPIAQDPDYNLSERLAFHDRQRLWLNAEYNAVETEWLSSTSTLPYYFHARTEEIFRSQFPIRQIAYFPKRNDVMLMAVSNGIFAMELDGRGGSRLSRSIYKGNSPRFARIGNTEALYVLDSNTLMRVELVL